MATWNSRGLRGSALEETINQTNEKYMEMCERICDRRRCGRSCGNYPDSGGSDQSGHHL